MSTPDCACKAINQAFGGCMGEFRECSIRCFALNRVGENRGARQASCLEKVTFLAQGGAPC